MMKTSTLPIIEKAVRTACRWRIPPHWAFEEWRSELLAAGSCAVCQRAKEECPCSRQDPLELNDLPEKAIFSYALHAMYTLYRREWRFATRYFDSPAFLSEPETDIIVVTDRQGFVWSDEVEIKIDLERGLSSLTDKERLVLMEYFFEGKTETEISEDFHISQPAVSITKQRAINKLRNFLSKDYP